jgi:predicted SnoaL-like aldol condensation-catalyzing enzyme
VNCAGRWLHGSNPAPAQILGEGDFVLVVAEATFGDVPTGIYDLYRIEDGKIAEHWDTLQAIPPRSDRKNSNGKF